MKWNASRVLEVTLAVTLALSIYGGSSDAHLRTHAKTGATGSSESTDDVARFLEITSKSVALLVSTGD